LSKTIAVLYNSRAGKGKAIRVANRIKTKLSSLQYKFEAFKDLWPEDLKAYTDVWIIGGDGTLNYFINKYPDCDLPLVIFKGGTGNDFAWKLFGNKNLEDCFSIALDALPRKTDAGVCNGKYFLNGVGIGFDGEIVKSIDREKTFFKGHLAYYAAALRQMFFFHENYLEVNAKDVNWKSPAFMLTVANGSRYGGGFLVAPDASVDDGLLDIILIPRISIFQRLNLLPGAGKGKHMRITQSTRSQYVTVRADGKVAAHFDGEAMEADNFEINVLPQKFLFRY
jgi:diacylglycerol kinase (ATP)